MKPDRKLICFDQGAPLPSKCKALLTRYTQVCLMQLTSKPFGQNDGKLFLFGIPLQTEAVVGTLVVFFPRSHHLLSTQASQNEGSLTCRDREYWWWASIPIPFTISCLIALCAADSVKSRPRELAPIDYLSRSETASSLEPYFGPCSFLRQ